MSDHENTAARASDPAADVLSLCCGGKKCPVFTKENGGVTVTDSAAMGDRRIELTAEDATKLRAWLQERGF